VPSVAGSAGLPHSLGGSDRFTKFLEPFFASEARVLQEEGRTSQLVAGLEEEHNSGTEWLLNGPISRCGRCWRGPGLEKATAMRTKGFYRTIAAVPPVYNTLLNKYYVDEGYDYVFTGRRQVGRRPPGRAGIGRSVVLGGLARD